MIATWHSGQPAPMVRGHHKKGTARRWIVTIVLLAGEGIKERFTLKPDQPLTLVDLQVAIDVVMNDFEAEHGRIKTANWQAIAR